MTAQPILDHGPGFNSRYEPHEDTTIIQMVRENQLPSRIAKRLRRSLKSVQRRMDTLRKEGAIPAYSALRPALETNVVVRITEPPLRLRDDDALVRACRELGGFPRAVVTPIGTIWATSDNLPWQYGRAVQDIAA